MNSACTVLRAALLRSGILAGLALLAACAGNGEGLDANGRPLVPGGTPSQPLSADFASIQENIFTPICSVCHAGGSAPEGLRLDAADSYSLLVGVPSTEVPALLRVKPGDPDNSYIIQKLEGHAAVGAQMPFGCPSTQPCLTSSAIGFIRQWITDGAAPAAAAAPAATASAPLAIIAMVPDRMDTVSAPPPQVMLAFNHDLDASQLAAVRMHFEKSAADSMAAENEQVAARITVSSANLRTLLIWPASSLAAGRYRLVVDAASSGLVSDIAGQVLALGSPDHHGAAVITTFDVEVPR